MYDADISSGPLGARWERGSVSLNFSGFRAFQFADANRDINGTNCREELIAHEWVHRVRTFHSLPRFFEEGLATYLARSFAEIPYTPLLGEIDVDLNSLRIRSRSFNECFTDRRLPQCQEDSAEDQYNCCIRANPDAGLETTVPISENGARRVISVRILSSDRLLTIASPLNSRVFSVSTQAEGLKCERNLPDYLLAMGIRRVCFAEAAESDLSNIERGALLFLPSVEGGNSPDVECHLPDSPNAIEVTTRVNLAPQRNFIAIYKDRVSLPFQTFGNQVSPTAYEVAYCFWRDFTTRYGLPGLIHTVQHLEQIARSNRVCRQVDFAQTLSAILNVPQEEVRLLMDHYRQSFQNLPYSLNPMCQ